MDKFTASNGYGVEHVNGALYVTNRADETRHTVGRYTIDALREFFQAERDEELGRWRWPENPDYVVYPAAVKSRVRVLRETGMGDLEWVDRGDGRNYEFCHAAHAYFEAHPEPKPWDGAKPGEVWVLTVPVGERPAVVRLDGAMCDEYGNKYAMTSITAARKIFPESD